MSIEASNQAFIIAAYAVTWIVLLGYFWRLLRKSARTTADYDRIAEGGENRS